MNFKIRNLKTMQENEKIGNIKEVWQKKEFEILKRIQLITGLPIKTDKTICYIDNSATHGCYGSRTITLGAKGGIKKDDILMVISHELFHIYYWRKIKKMKLTRSSPGNESEQEWKLAEVAAFLLTNEPSLKKYWPNAQVYLYPEIEEVYKKVKKFWKKGDIEYFLANSYNELQGRHSSRKISPLNKTLHSLN